MTDARTAAEAVYKLALRCEPIPAGLALDARPYIDAHHVLDPFNGRMTLDGRDTTAAWGQGWDGVQLPELGALLDGGMLS